MKLVREYLDGLCDAHDQADGDEPHGIRRWNCAPCLLAIIPAIRKAIPGVCDECRKRKDLPFADGVAIIHHGKSLVGYNAHCPASDLINLLRECKQYLEGRRS